MSGWRNGLREGLGTPAMVLAAGYLGYGALAADAGLSMTTMMLSTAVIWALPGQLILVEMNGAAAPLAAILLAVSLSAIRFLPMTVSLLPVLAPERRRRPALYATAHLISMAGWVAAMRRAPELPEPERLPYFVAYAAALWSVSIAATGLGWLVADALPPVTRSAFVFMNPVYFLLIMLGDARSRLMQLSLAAGALAGPLVYLIAPQWSVLAGGLLGGTAAFLIHRWLAGHD